MEVEQKSISIKKIKGVGEKTASYFSHLNIHTIGDLLMHFPLRYNRYEPESRFQREKLGEEQTILAMPIKPLMNIKTGRHRLISAVLSDGENTIKAIWFNSEYLLHSLKPFQKAVFIGKLSMKGNVLELSHPIVYDLKTYEKLRGRLIPVYPLTKGLSNTAVRKAVENAYSSGLFAQELSSRGLDGEYLPKNIQKKYALLSAGEALQLLHFPDSEESAKMAKKRLAFDEFFMFLYLLKLQCHHREELVSPYRISEAENARREIEAILNFSLTSGQDKALKEILGELSEAKPMNRLLQGDVGSGKTIVAIIALWAVVRSGYQGAIMVPTEVLARQHFESMQKLLNRLKNPPRVALLTGSMGKAEKREVLERLRISEIHILIGTHALIEDEVEFDSLALVITDEQHRFGVRQRQNLAQKGSMPHILAMSATPIPRTLAVILYADMEVSDIQTKPKGRLPIKNAVIEKKDREKAYAHIRKEVEAGHQAYVICPMIEENESVSAENVIDYTKTLRAYYEEKINISFIHGRMSQKEKDDIMNAFSAGEIDILVSTTVIEVGIDVANATVILIENAERFGLAALHQLRGRVGRGMAQSYCIFVRTSEAQNAIDRLAVVGTSNDGFYIASEDLRLRGPGEIFGVAQSGELSFAVADIYADAQILQLAKEVCDSLELSDLDKEERENLSLRLHLQKQNRRLSL